MEYAYLPRWRGFTMVMAAIVLSACVDTPLQQPNTPSIDKRFAVNADGPPQLHSNSQRYRQQTTAHATGRAGSASLTARALLGKDGQTDVELTTGQLDQTGAPGNIAKVQLKWFHPASTTEHEPTLNYNGLKSGGAWSKAYADRARHQTFQAQTNITGIDPKRTGVVTLTERVNLRPDIGVLSLNHPSTVNVGTNVTFLATVAELNGDVGATTNCVLYVNGVEKDRADGVWVADGDQVTCAFSHQFTTAGTFSVQASAESVVPGDWDVANNSKTSQITVTNPVLHGYAGASDYQYDNWYRNYGYNSSWWWYGYYQEWNYQYDNHYRDQYTYFYGATPAQWAKPFGVSALVKTNGYAFDGRWVSNWGNPASNCALLYTTGFNLESCTSPWGSYVYGYRWAGVSYYWSYNYYREWYCGYWGCSPGYGYGPYWSYGSNYWGTWYANLGADVTWDVDVVTSGTGNFTGDATIPLSTWYDYSDNYPFTCWSGSYYFQCYGYQNNYRYRSGYAYF